MGGETAMEPAPVPFDRLYEHREWVRRVARALVLDESRAADLEQQVWLRALERPPLATGSLRGWLRAVLRNTAGKMRRSEERVARRESASAARPAPGAPDDIVAETEAHERVVRAVLALEEPYRTTVLLRWFEDLSVDEVAARTGAPRETVRTRLRRALERVRARLDGEHGGDRRAWCVLLVPIARRASPEGSAPTAAGTAAAAVAGGLLMGTATKVAVAAAVVVVAGLALWRGTDGPAESPRDPGAAEKTVAAAPPGEERPRGPAAALPAAPVAAAPSIPEVTVEVVDTSGRPVAGARVEVLAPAVRPTPAQWQLPSIGLGRPRDVVAGEGAGQTGSATVRAPGAGRWTVRAEATGFVPVTHEHWFRVGDTVPLRIVLRRGATVVGSVRDAAGRPLRGAIVALDGSRYASSLVAIGSGSVGEDGSFRLDDVRPGQHRVFVHAPDGVVHFAETIRVPFAGSLDLRVGGGVTVRGRVTDAATGDAVEAASVAVTVQRGGAPWAGAASATTAADGTFLVRGLPPGDQGIEVVVVREGFHRSPPRERRERAFDGVIAVGTTWETEIRLQRGEDPGPGGLDLEVATGPPGVVKGLVVDADGAPAAEVELAVWSATAPMGPAIESVTDAEGRFRVDGVPAATGSVHARPGPVGLGGSAAFTLADGQGEAEISIRMRRAGSISGMVRRSDGAPVEGATVWWLSGGFAGPVRDHAERLARDDHLVPVDAVGAFRVDRLRPETHLIVATADGCSMEVSPFIQLEEGEDRAGVEIVLDPLAGIAGRVEDGAGAPVAGARAFAWDPGNRRSDPALVAVTGPDGRFAATGLPAGTLKVTAEAPGTTRAEVEAQAGREDLLLRVERVLSVSGRVVSKGDGAPAAGVPVRASPERRPDGRPSPRGRWETATLADGSFRIDGVTAGTWTVTAGGAWRGQPASVREETVRGVEAGAADVAIAVERGVAISGRFVDASGAAYTRPVSVSAHRRQPDGSLRSVTAAVRADGDGTFRLGGLEPGTCELWVRAGAGRGDEMASAMLVKGIETGTTDVVITVPAGVRLRGRVTNLPHPAELGRVHVWVRGAGESYWPARTPGVAADGTFETEPLDPNWTYDLVVSGVPGMLGSLEGVRPGAGQAVIEMSEGLAISGRVVDEAGDSVGAGVSVRAWALDEGPGVPGARSTTTTREDGRFRISGLGDFRFALNAGGSGGDFLVTSVGHPDGGGEPFRPGAPDVVLRVRRGLTARCRVLDGRGNPLVGARVQCLAGTGWAGQSREEGRFTVRGLEHSTFRLRIEGIEFGPFEVTDSEIEVRLPER